VPTLRVSDRHEPSLHRVRRGRAPHPQGKCDMKRPPRRTIIKAAALLLLGATLNVAMAWGLAIWSPIGPQWGQAFYDAASVPLEFRARVPAEWLQWPSGSDEGRVFHSVGTDRWDSFGLRMLRLYARTSRPGVMEVGDAEHICVVQCGWPFLALQTEGMVQWPSRVIGAGSSTPTISWVGGMHAPMFASPLNLDLSYSTRSIVRPIPWRVAPIAFTINTLFYAGVLWMVFLGPFALRRMSRRRRHRCAACNYPVGTNQRCTECGSPHAVTPHKEATSCP